MPYILKKYYPLRNIIFLIGEGTLIFIVFNSVNLFFVGRELYTDQIALYGARALVVTLTFQLCLYYFDLYDLSVIPSFSDTATRIIQAFGFGCIALAFIYYFFPIIIISTNIFWTAYLVICLSIALWRYCYTRILNRRMFAQPVLVLGNGVLAQNISAEIENKKDAGYKIAAMIGEGHGSEPDFSKNIPLYQNDTRIIDIIRTHNIEKVVVALDDKRGKMPIQDLMVCKLQGVPIITGIKFYEELTGKILVEKVNPSWIIFSDGFKQNRLSRMGKRVLDLLLSLTGLVVSLPLTLASALIIKLESPGPIFYSQERVGTRGKTFKVHKFRSMRSDAEKDGPVWASQNDARVTRFGAVIRKYRIDEIPQIFNVLKGDMSFVGPRPERPVFVEQLERNIPYYALRHYVKPGITGWAQVFYPYGASEEDALRKLEYDLYYIKNLSLTMDLWIIFQTVKTVLFKKGSR